MWEDLDLVFTAVYCGWSVSAHAVGSHAVTEYKISVTLREYMTTDTETSARLHNQLRLGCFSWDIKINIEK